MLCVCDYLLAAAQGLSVIRCLETVSADFVFLQGAVKVIQCFLVAFVGELPGAEMAGNGLSGTELAEGLYGFRWGDVSVADPVRLVSANGDERQIRLSEAVTDAGKTV